MTINADFWRWPPEARDPANTQWSTQVKGNEHKHCQQSAKGTHYSDWKRPVQGFPPMMSVTLLAHRSTQEVWSSSSTSVADSQVPKTCMEISVLT